MDAHTNYLYLVTYKVGEMNSHYGLHDYDQPSHVVV